MVREFNFDIVGKAMNYAFEKHKTQIRKTTKAPYFFHCLHVASILAREESPDYLIAAGFLHDVVEDSKYTNVTEGELRKKFGNEITDLVMEITETDKSLSWKERKLEKLVQLKKASREVKVLKCADNLANYRDSLIGYKKEGDKIWSYFNASKQDKKWALEETLKNLSELKDMEMYQELDGIYHEIFINS